MEEKISSRGNRTVMPVVIIIAMTLCMVAGEYRLKKSTELSRWKKEMEIYNTKLEKENLAAVKGQTIEQNPEVK